jgi:hypothetical protein
LAELKHSDGEASVKQRQEKSKQSLQDAVAPQATLDQAESAEAREAETPEGRARLECDSEELPGSDEETKVVLLPVNPYLVHVYWGIAVHDLEEVGRVFSRLGPRAQPVLRFYDITQVNFGGANASSWFDVEIALGAGNWYVHLESPAKSCCIDLGLRTAGGGFHRLARSNVAETPRACPSDKLEESYLFVEGDYIRAETPVTPGETAEVVETLPEPSFASEPRGGEGKWLEGVDASRSAPTSGESQGEEEKGQEPEELRFFRAASIGEIERKLAEFYPQRRWEWPSLAPQAEGTTEPQPSGKERADLTAVSERSFHTGLSSGQKSS